MKLTEADERLLSVLREDARAPTAGIARRLGLSRTTVHSRIERLEQSGVIVGYTVRVDDAVERGRIRAHIMLTVFPKRLPSVVRVLHAMPGVRALHSVSGGWDMIATVVAASVGEMDVLVDRIGEVEGVERTTTTIILSTKFER